MLLLASKDSVLAVNSKLEYTKNNFLLYFNFVEKNVMYVLSRTTKLFST